MKKLKRTLGLLLAVCVLVMSLPLTALAAASAYSDVKGHWAEKAIGTWSEYGVVHGDNGKFRPNDLMTRGEFATALSNLLGLEEKSENTFRDMTGKEWYADAVLKAHAAGILLGDSKGNANATSRIQRQEAFVMVGRALGVTPMSGDTSGALSGFDDKGKVSGWAKPMVAALIAGGYVNGTAPSTLGPAANINRASVMQLFGTTVKTYITKPGTYTADQDGFVVVKTQGDVSVSGDAAGIVVGAGSKGADVTVTSAKVKDGAKVDAPNSTVTLLSSEVGGVVTLSSSAKGAEIVVPAGTTVDKIVTQADDVTITGEGQVKAVEVAGGDKVDVSTPGTAVTVDKDAGSTVTAGGKPVKPGETVTTSGEGQGYGEDVGGGPIIPPTPQYTIEYYVNGAKAETKYVAQSDEAKAPAPTAPSVPGYTFGSDWYTDADCTQAYDDTKAIKEILGENGGTTLKLYIKGTPITYTVTFDGNGSDGGSTASMSNVAYNTTDTLTANGFTRTGYTFQGWATTAGGTVAYADGAPAKELTTENGATVTLYAVWQGNTYTVTYKANEGTGDDVPVDFTYGGAGVTILQANDCPFTRTGYRFSTWNTNADGTGTEYTGGTGYSDAAGLTLYAQWEVNKYTVSYDTDGGSNIADTTNVSHGSTISDPGTPTKEGYDFGGWYKEEGLTNAWNFASDTVTATTTLYAKWTIKKYTVTFDVKGGSQVTGDGITDGQLKNVEHGSAISAPTAPTRTGYTFKGWYKEDTYTTQWDFATDKVTEATTLYANWEINKYTVTFNSNGGSPVGDISNVSYDTTITAPSEPTKEGHEFKGWFKDEEVTNAWTFAIDKVTENTTLYAKWDLVTYTVTYDGNGGTGDAPDPGTWTWGEEFLAAGDNGLTKTDCRFDGWNTKTDGTGASYAAGAPITGLTGDITLYAQWVDTTAGGTIKYDANGGSGTIADQSYNAGESPTLTANNDAITREGYTFTGWNRNADGSGQSYADGAALPQDPGNITLYAQWAMDVTLRLSEGEFINSNGIGYLQENSQLSIDPVDDADRTYAAVGVAKYVPYCEDYFSNQDGAKFSTDEAPVENEHDLDCSGRFLVFDIVDENGKYQEGTTTVVVKGKQGDTADAVIVANDKITFAEVEGKPTATVMVKLDVQGRPAAGLTVEVDWDGNGAGTAVAYTLNISSLNLQAKPINENTITGYTDLENDTTAVAGKTGGADLYPKDLLKDITVVSPQRVTATLRYVKDIIPAEETASQPGHYLAFQVNSPEELTSQPTGQVKLYFDWGPGCEEAENYPDGNAPEGVNVRYPDVVLNGDQFTKSGNVYTATMLYKVDDPANPPHNIFMTAQWMADNTWNKDFTAGVVELYLNCMPQDDTALMITHDANVENTDHPPFFFGTSWEDGGRTAQDMFFEGGEQIDFKITKDEVQTPDGPVKYTAHGRLRYVDDFRGYANDRYPGASPDENPEGSENSPNWVESLNGNYLPVDIVNVNGADVTYAQAKVYDGEAVDESKLLYTIGADKFNRTVQNRFGEAGYDKSATLIQRLNGLTTRKLTIVVDWNTTDAEDGETFVLDLNDVGFQGPSRVNVSSTDSVEDVTYGTELGAGKTPWDEDTFTGTLIYQTNANSAGGHYSLPVTFTAPEEYEIKSDADFVLSYRLIGPGLSEDPEQNPHIVLGGSEFAAGRSHTVLLPLPDNITQQNRQEFGLQINVDWDGRDYGDMGPIPGQLKYSECGCYYSLVGLTLQAEHHLISAHSLMEGSLLEGLPADTEYKYAYLQGNPGGNPTKAEATVTLNTEWLYSGKRAEALVGQDFGIASTDGTAYTATGMVKFMEDFDSYWYKYARDTFYYRSDPPAGVSASEEYAAIQLINAGLMDRNWVNLHSNAAASGYYLVFDLDKAELGTNGKIEIYDSTVSEGATAVRTIHAADFGSDSTIPVVYRLNMKDSEPAPGTSPFANTLTIKYYNDGTTETKAVTLVPDGDLYPQARSSLDMTGLVEDVADQQTDMLIRPAGSPTDVSGKTHSIVGGMIPANEGGYTLTLKIKAPEGGFPQVWDSEANDGEGGMGELPADAVVVTINPHNSNGDLMKVREITKGDFDGTTHIATVNIGQARLMEGGYLDVLVNWAGDRDEGWCTTSYYISLQQLVWAEGNEPFDPATLGTIVKSNFVAATDYTITGTGNSDLVGQKGTPSIFGVVKGINVTYTGLQPTLLEDGEVGNYGAFALKAPEGATKAISEIIFTGDPENPINVFDAMKGFQNWYLADPHPQDLRALGVDESDPTKQVMGIDFHDLDTDYPYVLCVQWGGDAGPIGKPVYYEITFTSNSPVENGTKSQMRLSSVPDRSGLPWGFGGYTPALDPDCTWLYLNGSYKLNNTWQPAAWQPLYLVSSEDSTYPEGYYVELEVLAPSDVEAAGTVCTITGGAISGSITITADQLKTVTKDDDPDYKQVWFPVVIPVAAADANTSGHPNNVTFVLDWDDNGTAYESTTYTLDLSNIALGGTKPAPTE